MPFGAAEEQIIDAAKNYSTDLHKVSESAKLRIICLQALTPNMYYQRLNYPQNISTQEVNALAKLLKDDSLIQRFEEAHTAGHQLTRLIDDNLKRADITVTFLCKKVGMDTSNFYRKQKDPRLWTLPQIEKITQVVETINKL